MIRLKENIISGLKNTWLLATLIGSITLLMASSLRAAHLIGNATYVYASAVLGVICGAAIGKSNFRRGMFWPYSLVLSCLICLLGVGSILPPLKVILSYSLTESVYLMNLRLQILFSQFGLWVPMLLTGKSVEGTRLYDFLLSVGIWNLNVWLVWSVVRRKRPIQGLIPYAVILALVVYFHHLSLDILLGFLFCSGILMASTAYADRIADWNERRVNYPEINLDWTIGAFLVVLFTAGIARLSPVVGTQEGRRSINDFFQELRPKAAESRPSVSSSSGWLQPEGEPVFSIQTPELDIIGAPLPVSDATVFWVSISDPPPDSQVGVGGSTSHRYYWRSAIYSEYFGSGWDEVEMQAGQFISGLQGVNPAGRKLLSQHFDLIVPHEDVLFSASMPNWASDGVKVKNTLPDGDVLLKGQLANYNVTSWVPHVTEAQLVPLVEEYPQEILDEYLQLPDTLPDRVHELAARLVVGIKSPYEKAVQIRDYLRMTYVYSLDVPGPPTGIDAVDYFLFGTTGGFCTYYASSMVVMLRSQGVPARVAVGYAMGEYDQRRDSYRVPAKSSHAWVEVYFPHYGWIEFEPTPALPIFDYQHTGESTRIVEGGEELLGIRNTVVNIRILSGILWTLVLGGGLILTFYFWKIFIVRRSGVVGQVHTLYWQVRRALALVGIEGEINATPAEYLQSSKLELIERGRLRSVLMVVTDLYNRANFSSRSPHENELVEIKRLWRRTAPGWVMLWLKMRLTRLFLNLRYKVTSFSIDNQNQ
jgi:hypothetical protein